MKTGRFLAIFLFLVFSVTQSIFPLEIDGHAPTFRGEGAFASIVNELNTNLQSSFTSVLNDIRDEVGGINPRPTSFIRAWGNSSVFASHGATQRAYGGYNLFSVTVGSMIGLQLPSSPFDIADEFDNILDTLYEGDLQLGFNPQAFVAQVGVNTSRFLLDNLYLGLRFGYVNIRENTLIPIDGFSYDTFTLGILANYQLFSGINLGRGLLQWRGLNLGTGFIFSRTNVRYRIAFGGDDGFQATLPEMSETVDGETIRLPDVGLRVDPRLSFDMNINTFTIPLEAVTSVRLFWFLNLALGLGVDLAFGSSNIRIGMESDINVTGLPAQITQEKPGYLETNAGGRVAPSFFNPKLMTGLGFNVGPVLIDIPVTWYFRNHGFNVGVTVGFSL